MIKLKIKARDLNFTLVTFWILCNGHADSLGVKKQVGQKWPFPVVKGLKFKTRPARTSVTEVLMRKDRI